MLEQTLQKFSVNGPTACCIELSAYSPKMASEWGSFGFLCPKRSASYVTKTPLIDLLSTVNSYITFTNLTGSCIFAVSVRKCVCVPKLELFLLLNSGTICTTSPFYRHARIFGMRRTFCQAEMPK